MIPDRFHGMSHAKSALETIIPNILLFLRSKGHEWYRHRLATDPLPEELAAQLTNFKYILQEWLEVFNQNAREAASRHPQEVMSRKGTLSPEWNFPSM
jgi:hypothetical protein